MRTPSIYDIKYATQDKQPYFFTRDSMKFFGQTMKDFHVRKSPTGRIFVYAPMYMNGRRISSYTFREFTGDNLVLVREVVYNDLTVIDDYIRTH